MTGTLAKTLTAAAWVLMASIAVASSNPLHNYQNPVDVDANGNVMPRDLLLVVNQLLLQEQQQASLFASLAASPSFYYDTTDDNRISPRDALLVINHMLATPEPGSILSASMGLAVLAGYCWQRRRRMRK